MAFLGRSSRTAVPPCAPLPVFSQVISPEKTEPTVSPEGIQTELDEEMENDICKVWDMSMDEVGVMCGSQTSRVVHSYGRLLPCVFSQNPGSGRRHRITRAWSAF